MASEARNTEHVTSVDRATARSFLTELTRLLLDPYAARSRRANDAEGSRWVTRDPLPSWAPASNGGGGSKGAPAAPPHVPEARTRGRVSPRIRRRTDEPRPVREWLAELYPAFALAHLCRDQR